MCRMASWDGPRVTLGIGLSVYVFSEVYGAAERSGLAVLCKVDLEDDCASRTGSSSMVGR